MFSFIKTEEIIEEIDCDFDYLTLTNQILGGLGRMFLESFLNKLNENILLDYSNKIIVGEESFYGMIIFNGDDNEDELERLISIQKEVNDTENLINSMIKNQEWEDTEDIIYILKLSSYY